MWDEFIKVAKPRTEPIAPDPQGPVAQAAAPVAGHGAGIHNEVAMPQAASRFCEDRISYCVLCYDSGIQRPTALLFSLPFMKFILVSSIPHHLAPSWYFGFIIFCPFLFSQCDVFLRMHVISSFDMD